MRLSEIGELSLVEKIRDRFAEKPEDIVIGIGDDSAAIKPLNGKLLLTTDMMVEGIHFDLRFSTPYQLGYKLISVNVSDIFAMGGKPRYVLLDIAVSRDTEESFITKFLDGARDAMKLYRAHLVGGDVSSSKRDMAISATLIGYAEKPIRRSGAKSGDRIYVTGNLGDSACGLEILKRLKKAMQDAGCRMHPPLSPLIKGGIKGGYHESCIMNRESSLFNTKLLKLGLTWHMVKPLINRHLMPEARNPKGIANYATAMIDLSDGLLIDLSRLCAESKVGARIYKEYIPISNRMKKVSSALRLDSFKLASSGGEDYELLFTTPETSFTPSSLRRGSEEIKITCIGEITKSGKIIVDKKGRETAFSPKGYQHFGTQR